MARIREDNYRKFLCVRPSPQACADEADNATVPGNCDQVVTYLPEQDNRRPLAAPPAAQDKR